MSSSLTVFVVSMVQGWEGSGRAVILEALGSTDSMNQYMKIDLCGQVSHTELLNSVNQSQNWSSICWPANAKEGQLMSQSSMWRPYLYPTAAAPLLKVLRKVCRTAQVSQQNYVDPMRRGVPELGVGSMG